jgi:PST family polysaccharide transporter
VAHNIQQVLLGHFWGAVPLGFYGRASQLIGVPLETLNYTIGPVAFAALSRIQNDPPRLKRYFLKGYSIVVAMFLPISVACALFSHDLISLLLGPKWKDAVGIFLFLAPTIFAFSMLKPLGWLLNSLGMVERNLKIALALAPFLIVGSAIGLPYGTRGVAIGYSTVMTLGIVPISAWAVRGTVVCVFDVVLVLGRPLASSVVAAGLAYAAHLFYGATLHLLPRLLLEGTLFSVTYLAVLLFVVGQKSFYLDLLKLFYLDLLRSVKRALH